MSQYNEGIKTFTADEAIGRRIRVKLSATGVAICGAGEEGIGTTIQSVASGGNASVKLDAAGGSHVGTSSGSISIGDSLYAAASGALSATISGRRQGIALEAVSTATAFEFVPTGVNS